MEPRLQFSDEHDGKPCVRWFLSYARKDKYWKTELLTELLPSLRTSGNFHFELFDDSQILLGERWNSRIIYALERAHIGVLLISPNFLSSEFIRNVELPRLVGQDAAGIPGKRVVPIALKSWLDSTDLRGLEDSQIFQGHDDGPFAKGSAERRAEWVHSLAEDMESMLMRYTDPGDIHRSRPSRPAPPATPPRPEPIPPPFQLATTGSAAAAVAPHHPAMLDVQVNSDRSGNGSRRLVWWVVLVVVLLGLSLFVSLSVVQRPPPTDDGTMMEGVFVNQPDPGVHRPPQGGQPEVVYEPDTRTDTDTILEISPDPPTDHEVDMDLSADLERSQTGEKRRPRRMGNRSYNRPVDPAIEVGKQSPSTAQPEPKTTPSALVPLDDGPRTRNLSHMIPVDQGPRPPTKPEAIPLSAGPRSTAPPSSSGRGDAVPLNDGPRQQNQ